MSAQTAEHSVTFTDHIKSPGADAVVLFMAEPAVSGHICLTTGERHAPRSSPPLTKIMRVGEGVMHSPHVPRERGQCYDPVACDAAPAPAEGCVSGSARNLAMICGTSGDVMKL